MIAALYSCSVDNLKKGQMLTWYLTPTLIIKTKSGERNELINHEATPISIRLDIKKYVGNFPFGYQPTKQALLDAETIAKIENSKIERSVRAPRSREVFFDIALNGSKFKTNDFAFGHPDSRVHKDQVSVKLVLNEGAYNGTMSETDIKKGTYDEKLSRKLGLECYNVEKSYTHNEKTTNFNVFYCVGYPKDKSLPTIQANFEKLDSNIFTFSTNNEKYGINISWKVHRSHLKDWEKIHKEIFRLIEVWNVAPQSTSDVKASTGINQPIPKSE